MNDKVERILIHIGRFTVSLRPVMDRLFGEGSTCDHLINRLVREGRIVSRPGIPGGMCYYQLTLSEVRARSLPEHRARPIKGRALRVALQVLLFCCMSGKERTRLERKQLKAQSLESKGSGKPHCVEKDGEGALYRIYAPGPNSRLDYLLKTLRIDLQKAEQVPVLQEWVSAQAFGFAVLVETPERKMLLERLIEKHGPRRVKLLIEVVPGLSSLAEAMRGGGRNV